MRKLNSSDAPKLILGDTIEQLTARLAAEHSRQLVASQKAWDTYREVQSNFASLQAEGGTMQPLLYWSEMTCLTVERIVALRIDLDFLKSVEA